MEFRILGPLEVIEQGRSLPLGGIRQRALLAALPLRANTSSPPTDCSTTSGATIRRQSA
jgi:hypothetical protein